MGYLPYSNADSYRKDERLKYMNETLIKAENVSKRFLPGPEKISLVRK